MPRTGIPPSPYFRRPLNRAGGVNCRVGARLVRSVRWPGRNWTPPLPERMAPRLDMPRTRPPRLTGNEKAPRLDYGKHRPSSGRRLDFGLPRYAWAWAHAVEEDRHVSGQGGEGVPAQGVEEPLPPRGPGEGPRRHYGETADARCLEAAVVAVVVVVRAPLDARRREKQQRFVDGMMDHGGLENSLPRPWPPNQRAAEKAKAVPRARQWGNAAVCKGFGRTGRSEKNVEGQGMAGES
jgi:hypothetical protein